MASMSERIQETEVNPKYSYLVEDILRDKEYDGKLNYFAPSNSSSYDIILGKLRLKEDALKKTITENQSNMDKLIEELSNMNSKGKKKNEAESTLLKLQEAYVNMKSSLENISDLINKCEINQYAEKEYMIRMRILRDKYLFDDDIVFLEKGISWVIEYTDKMRISIDLDSFPKC
jgi:hypothetical protein